MLATLPPELGLQILSRLSLSEIGTIQLVSRSLHHFVHAHEESIYHAAAAYHHFITNTSLQDASSVEPSLCRWGNPDQPASWKTMCRAWYVTEQNWNGFGHVLEGPFSLHWASKPLAMHVDEDAGTILTLHEESVIILSSLESGEIVEKLDESPGRIIVASARVSKGTVVFNRWADDGEVGPIVIWGRQSSGPDDYVIRHVVPPPEKSTFEGPMAFNSPLLAIVANSPNALQSEVLVYDILDGALVRRIHLPTVLEQTWIPQATDRILHLRLSVTHVLVCYATGVLLIPLLGADVVADNSSGDACSVDSSRAFAFPSRSMAMDAPHTMLQTAPRVLVSTPHPNDRSGLPVDVSFAPSFGTNKATLLPGTHALSRAPAIPPAITPQANSTAIVMWSASPTGQRFNSACISPSGRHFAAINEYGLLYLSADFARVARHEIAWETVTTRLVFPPPATQLMWQHEERLVIKSGGHIFIVNLNPNHHRTLRLAARIPMFYNLPAFPHLTVHTLVHFSDKHGRMAHKNMSAVTSSGIWTLSSLLLLQRRIDRTLAGLPSNGRHDPDVGPEGLSIVFVDFSAGALKAKDYD